jgi:hypothetical protein
MDRMSSAKMPAMWGQAHELRAFAEQLEPRVFTALSQGLGFGELRPKVEKTAATPEMNVDAAHASRTRLAPSPSPASPSLTTPRTAANAPSALPQASARLVDKAQAATTAPPRAKAGLEQRFMAGAVDLLFVTASLAVALAAATWLAGSRAGGEVSVLELRPVAWLAAFAPYQILLGVYGIYLAYNVLFRAVRARTFGAALLGLDARRFTAKSSEFV